MSQANTVTVHILDKEYCIACPADGLIDRNRPDRGIESEDLLPDLAENTSIVCMTEKAFPISPSIVAHSIWQI